MSLYETVVRKYYSCKKKIAYSFLLGDLPRNRSSPSYERNIQNYYNSWESRIGYRFLLGGTRHHGYYESSRSWPWPVDSALRRMEDLLFAELDLQPGSKVLDCGCGVGHVAIHLAHKDLDVSGIDITDHHVVKANRNIRAANLSDKVQLVKGDYHDLSQFSNEHFDGLYTMETFVHSPHPEIALREFFRVLKPGARVVFHEYVHPPLDSLSDFMQRALTWANTLGAMPGLERFQYGVLEDLVKEAGFESIESRDMTENILPMVWLFSLVSLLPYLIIAILRLQPYFVNTVSGFGAYYLIKHHRIGGYVVVADRKPSFSVSEKA